jgi:hypothetical protein
MTNELLKDLSDVFPPLEISLPTRGHFYSPGVLNPAADPTNIAVGTLGVMDEFKYRDPYLLVSGKAIGHLIHHLCGEQVLLPEELCEIDVETILLAARIASYGPNLQVKHTCPRPYTPPDGEESPCKTDNTVLVDLSRHILRYEAIEDEERFELVLPRVGQTVYLKPIPYKTTVELLRHVMMARKRAEDLNMEQHVGTMQPDDFVKYEEIVELNADVQIKAILDCIWAVKTRSGTLVEDPMMIAAWIFELPNTDHDAITKRISEISEDFRKLSTIRYQCGNCGQENEFNLQMNSEILFLAESEASSTLTMSSDLPPKNKNTLRTPSRISPRQRSRSPGQSATMPSAT